MTRVVGEFDGLLSLDADVGDGLSYTTNGDSTVYVTRPNYPPLSKEETSARLKITTEDGDVRAIVRLDAVGLDALADAVAHTQRALREELA